MSYSREECVEALKEAKKELGHTPTISEYNDLQISPSSHSTIVDKFGSWNNAKEEAGLDKNKQNNKVVSKPESVKIPENKKWKELTPYQRYYYKNRDEEKQRIKDRTKELKKWFREYKSNFECERCGEDHTACLDFHHQGKKENGVTELVSRKNTSKARIKEEIEKCVPLCANCHRKEHSETHN